MVMYVFYPSPLALPAFSLIALQLHCNCIATDSRQGTFHVRKADLFEIFGRCKPVLV